MNRLKDIYLTTYFNRFFWLNTIGYVIAEVVLIYWISGDLDGFPYLLLKFSIFASIPIILIQYPMLRVKKNWFYRAMILYLGMVTFSIVFGAILAWSQIEEEGWLYVIGNGLAMLLLSHLVGWIFLIPLVMLNYVFAPWVIDEGQRGTDSGSSPE